MTKVGQMVTEKEFMMVKINKDMTINKYESDYSAGIQYLEFILIDKEAELKKVNIESLSADTNLSQASYRARILDINKDIRQLKKSIELLIIHN